MTTKARKKRLPQQMSADDRRRWRNNLPLGPGRRHQWTPEERERRLKFRAALVDRGITRIVSILLSAVVWVMQVREQMIGMQLEIAAMRNDVQQIRSWFGVPPPRNPGQ